MNINDALHGVERIYIETAPLIYYVEENPRYIATMEAIISRIEHTDLRAMSSVITLAEVLSYPIKLGNRTIEQSYRDILINNESLQLISINIQVADVAARLRATYGLRTPDALHIASAIHMGCQVFLTNDKGITRVKDLQIILLDDLTS